MKSVSKQMSLNLMLSIINCLKDGKLKTSCQSKVDLTNHLLDYML